ncbi:MAG: GNAT family N-acetyltransferase [Acidobacteriia bacterium]|nr:GNAT family N-acetyltransferase [Terriglobia bacterium]
MTIDPVTLEGQFIRLEPLSMAHHAGLVEAGLDEAIWRYMPQTMRTPDDMRAFIEAALETQATGAALPFATIDLASGSAIGSTRFFNIDRAHRRLEIGWTWLGLAWQGTAANTEAKYLMLRHAFETLECIRVEFKTDSLNERSRAALLRIGAIQEGTFRNHMIMPDGRLRHSVYYSLIASEWPEVKARLEQKLAAR